MRQAFRTFAASTLLVIYLAMMAVSGVMTFACNCRLHSHSVVTHQGACTHAAHLDKAAVCPIDGFAFTQHCTCNHHSTDIALYTSRSTDDDAATRNTIPVIAAELPADVCAQAVDDTPYAYGEYRSPLPTMVSVRENSLRAPPALV